MPGSSCKMREVAARPGPRSEVARRFRVCRHSVATSAAAASVEEGAAGLDDRRSAFALSVITRRTRTPRAAEATRSARSWKADARLRGAHVGQGRDVGASGCRPLHGLRRRYSSAQRASTGLDRLHRVTREAGRATLARRRSATCCPSFFDVEEARAAGPRGTACKRIAPGFAGDALQAAAPVERSLGAGVPTASTVERPTAASAYSRPCPTSAPRSLASAFLERAARGLLPARGVRVRGVLTDNAKA